METAPVTSTSQALGCSCSPIMLIVRHAALQPRFELSLRRDVLQAATPEQADATAESESLPVERWAR